MYSGHNGVKPSFPSHLKMLNPIPALELVTYKPFSIMKEQEKERLRFSGL